MQKAELHQNNQIDRSVWAHTKLSTVEDAYGDNFHPFSRIFLLVFVSQRFVTIYLDTFVFVPRTAFLSDQ